MALMPAESVAAAETSNGEVSVAPLLGLQTVTVRFAPVGVQVAAQPVAAKKQRIRTRTRRARGITNESLCCLERRFLLAVASV